MDSELKDLRYAPPQAHVADVQLPAGQLELASRGRRLAASVIDAVLLSAVLGLLSVLAPWGLWRADGGYWSPHLAAAALGFTLFMLMNGYLLLARGQTLGKAALSIRIARPDGALASPARLIVLRYGVGGILNVIPAVGQIFSVLDALFIFRASRRCLHDQIADTVVLRA